MASSVSTPTINTKTTVGSAFSAPTVALATISATQVPVMVEHVLNQTVGEEPLYLVRMKDNTLCYLKQSLLTQSGGKIVV